MGMGINLDINGGPIGKAFVRRTGFLDLSDKNAIADTISVYEVYFDDKLIGHVHHRYGDGAWKLTAIVSELIHTYEKENGRH